MKITKLSLIVISSLFCLGLSTSVNKLEVVASSNGSSAPSQNYSSEYNVSYYSSIVGKTGTNLLNGLATISQNNHKFYTSYTALNGGLAYADEDPNDSSKVLDFYTHWSVTNVWNSGGNWNKEHVWPQSLSGGLYGKSYAGSDIHHIRATIPTINSKRGNLLFGDVENTSSNKYYYNSKDTGCYVSSSVFEPNDISKGDTARIIMYMYMHYSKEVSANASFSKAGNLDITNVIYTSKGTSQAAWDLLLSWNKLDPVDELEVTRNNYCTSVTGLRNPFIDHYEFADMIWDSNYSGDGALNDQNFDYLTLASSTASLKVGDTFQINATTNIENPTFEYNSNDTSVATVTSSGLVEAVGSGTTNINVKVNDLNAILTVNVSETTSSGGDNVSVAGEGITYTVSSTTNVDSKNEVSGTTAVYSQTYGTASQITSGNNAKLVLSGYSGYKLKGFTLSMKSNTSKGAGSLTVSSGSSVIYTISDSKFNTENWYGAWSTTYVDITRSLVTPYEIKTNEDLIFLITSSTNSLYIESFTLYFETQNEENNISNIINEISSIKTQAQIHMIYSYHKDYEKAENSAYEYLYTIDEMNYLGINYEAKIPEDLFEYVDSFGFTIIRNNQTYNINLENYSYSNGTYSFSTELEFNDYNEFVEVSAYVIIDGSKVNLTCCNYSVKNLVAIYIDSNIIAEDNLELLLPLLALNNWIEE